MTIWPPDPATLERPLYRSLAQSLIDAIAAGEVRQGDRLPTHRDLAEQLRVSVQTVSRAYDELIRLGIIAGRVGSGTFVRAASGDARTPWHRVGASDGVIDLSMLTPVLGDIHGERMSATLARLAQDAPPDTLFSFRPRSTLQPHVEAALSWLKRCGVSPNQAQVLPTNGNTPAMTVALMTAAKPGELVVSEEVGHHTLKPLCHYLGLRIVGLEMDDEGVTPGAFAHACRTDTVRVLCVLPSGLNPLARTMGEARREELAAIARAHDVTIVENDAWGPLQPDRPAPFATIAPERTFYFTGLTKCLVPGLRLGWLVVPETLVSAAANRHLVTNWMATAMVAEMGRRWIREGTAVELLNWQRAALQRRNRLALEALKGLSPLTSPNGLHVWLPLPDQWVEDAFVTHARLEGVAVAAGSAFAIGEAGRWPGIRICLGGPSEADMLRGLETVARLARNQPEPALLTI